MKIITIIILLNPYKNDNGKQLVILQRFKNIKCTILFPITIENTEPFPQTDPSPHEDSRKSLEPETESPKARLTSPRPGPRKQRKKRCFFLKTVWKDKWKVFVWEIFENVWKSERWDSVMGLKLILCQQRLWPLWLCKATLEVEMLRTS